ncbi:MAG: DUF4139 domain-containing protein [Rhodospirillaceae bacterium]|nr:DUF4139 domain-containing protein [Rhodospirillaceae bacterium]
MPNIAPAALSRRTMLVAALLSSTVLVHPALAQSLAEKRVTLAEQTSVAVAIYNNNLALVRDTRRITLDAGRNRLAMVDVSAQLRAETALLAPLGNAQFRLIEQNLEFDLLTPQKLLEKSVGKEVTIVKTNPQTGEETRLRALVLSTASGVVLKIGNEIHTSAPGRIVFDNVPPNLRDRPTLTIDLETDKAGTMPVELTYLTSGLSWRADYVAMLADKEDRLDLNGWVTLVNRSGTTYRDAKLQLIAGDPNRVRAGMDYAREERAAPPATARKAMRTEAVFDYHLYELDRPTTIAENQQKQVALLSAGDVKVAKEYRLESAGQYYRSRYSVPGTVKATIWLHFENDKKANLGLPLPRGVVRVYKRDSAGKAVFVGEDNINHTAEGERVRLKVGQAFDVSGVRTQTDFKSEVAWSVYESAYKIALNNGKDEAVTVTIAEIIPGDWRILQESHLHEKVTSNLVEWKIPVPAKSKAELTFRVRTKF